MADNGVHPAAQANGDVHPPAMAENGDDQAAAAAANGDGHAQDMEMEAGGGNQAAAAANGGIHAQDMEMVASGGNHAQDMEMEASGDNQAAAAQDVGSQAEAEAEYWVMGAALRRQPVPEEALYQVLLCMSAADLARWSAASGRVRDLISTEAFRRDHHRHRSRQPMPLFFYRLHFVPPDVVRVDLRGVDIAARESRPVIRFDDINPDLPNFDPIIFTIQGSCDGILLFSYHTRLYACNPCTHRWGRLPPLHTDNDIVAFYGHGPLDNIEYRVLYHPKRGQSDCRYWIFSLSFPDQPARCIRRALNLEVADLALAHGIVPSYTMPPIAIGHRLHWRPQIGQDNHNVLLFDTVAEAFQMIPPPRVLEGDVWIQVDGDQLLEINGMLAMTLISHALVDVWVLQEGDVWADLYQILLPVPHLSIFNGYDDEGFVSATVLAMSQERNVLAQFPRIMLQCDTMGNVLKSYCLSGYLTVLSRYMLQESLLMHAFLPLGQDDLNDGDPPFF